MTACAGRERAPAQVGDVSVVVGGRKREAADVISLELRAAEPTDLPSWRPGAHIDVVLDGGATRQYSLCGDPLDRRRWRIAVLNEKSGRGGSAYIHDQVHPGERLTVRGPRNNFALVDAPRHLFIAGGIGITPFLPMIAELTRAERPWRLVYGGRSRASMAFLDELTQYQDRVRIWPQDELGLLDLNRELADAAGGAVYCCGPEGLLSAVESRAADWPPGTLHVERFSPREQTAPAKAHGFVVELARSGRSVTVRPEQSIIDALAAAGVPVESSCELGICGTCETKILSGAAEHRDSILSAAERQAQCSMMICVSTAIGDRIVLDL